MKKSRKIVVIISIGLLIAGSIWQRGMEQYEIAKYPAVVLKQFPLIMRAMGGVKGQISHEQ